MDFAMLLVTFTSLWKLSSCITCYKCAPEYRTDEPWCEHFDTSDPQFYVECPYSTMCYKWISHFKSGAGLATTIVGRGCASQTWDGDQERINGKWTPVKKIYEKYTEGCAEDPSNNQRAAKTTNCYCRGDYCNSSQEHWASSWTIIVAVFMCFAMNNVLISGRS